MSWIHGFEKSTLEKLSGVRFEVEEVEYEGGKECGKDEENKPEPVLKAKNPCDCTGEAGGDELDVVNRVVIEEDMRGKQPLLLVVRSWGRHTRSLGRKSQRQRTQAGPGPAAR